MKDKPTRHRMTNTFHFEGELERLSKVRVSIRNFKVNNNVSTSYDDNETYFRKALDEKWNLLNLSQAFQDFKRAIGDEIDTVPQLLLKQTYITSVIVDFLKKKDEIILAQEPILDLTVCFAMDLPLQFYQNSFYEIMPVLIDLLHTRNHESIRRTFDCFVSLFEVSKKYLQDDFFKLYHDADYSCLLSKKYPWFINELAAHSLSFLVRKLPKKKEFLCLAFQKLEKEATQMEGVGRLIACMMKLEVVNRLHSCTPSLISTLIEILEMLNHSSEMAMQSILFSLKELAKHITVKKKEIVTWQQTWKEDSQLVWPQLLKELQNKLEQKNTTVVKYILGMISEIVSYKFAILVVDVNGTLESLIPTLKSDLCGDIGAEIVLIVSSLFLSTHHNPMPKLVQKVTKSILVSSISNHDKFVYIDQVSSSKFFDSNILPMVLEYVSALVLNKDGLKNVEVLTLLTNVICKKRVTIVCGKDLTGWEKVPLDFSIIVQKYQSKSIQTIPQLIEAVLTDGFSADFNNFEEILLALACLPHVIPIDVVEVTSSLCFIMSSAFELLGNFPQNKIYEDDKVENKKKRKSCDFEIKDNFNLNLNIEQNVNPESEKLLFLISTIIETMALTLSRTDFLEVLSSFDVLDIVEKNPQYRENVHILKSLDIHLTCASEHKDEILTTELFDRIYGLFVPCLASPSNTVRLITAHMFSLFSFDLPPVGEDAESPESMFTIMFNVENLDVTPYNFKERLRFLSMLDSVHIFHHIPISNRYHHAPLLFFIGQLYINFKSLWSPITKLIADHALYMEEELFWPIWYSKLKFATHCAKKELHSSQVCEGNEKLLFDVDALSNIYNSLIKSNSSNQILDRPDFINFRDLLWQAMQQFPEVCRHKNKVVVRLFLDFLEEEFFPVDYNVAPSQNIQISNDSDLTVDQSYDNLDDTSKSIDRSCDNLDDTSKSIDRLCDNLDDTSKSIDLAEDETSEVHHSKRRSAPTKSLYEHLALFAKFRNSKSISNANILEEKYNYLLSHPNPKIQLVSLDCILSLGHKYLMPYKDNLHNIVNDKTFKEEITLFSIDGTDSPKDENVADYLKEEHRAAFMPVLIRILFGKMQHKTGPNSSGKALINKRKAVILRFLANARETELDVFFQLAFDIVLSHIRESPLETVEYVMLNVDLSKVIPLKRMQGTLSTLENIIDKLGNLLTHKRSCVLMIILVILGNVVAMLNRQSEIDPHNLPAIKNLRKLALNRLIGFFKEFSNYEWSREEMEAVFKVAVWPSLSNLPNEGINAPTPLMRLFICWSENRRYHILFSKHEPSNKDISPIPFLIKLINHEKCSSAVSSHVLSIIEQLLTPHDEDPMDVDEENVAPIVCDHLLEYELPENKDKSLIDGTNVLMLLPCLDNLLACMKNLLSTLARGEQVVSRDLHILSQLAQWITSSTASTEFLELILPLLVKKCIKEDKLVLLLEACGNLLPISSKSMEFLHPLLKLFSVLDSTPARTALCNAFNAFSTIDERLKYHVDVAFKLNSWNRKMIEEFDYESRLNVYHEVSQYLQESISIDVDLCLLLIHNSMYFIVYVDDSSIRDSATLCLQHLMDMLGRLHDTLPKETEKILNEALLPELKHGLRKSKENVRDLCMQLLGRSVHTCSNFNSRLKDLHKLTSDDPETDFFVNMCHIQLHRRSRALAKLSEKIEDNTLSFQVETLTEYLLPISSTYLFKDIYGQNDYLISSSVNCIGTIAKLLPWYPYQTLLKYYLNLFSRELNQLKQAVKVLDAIIEAFHEEVVECDLKFAPQIENDDNLPTDNEPLGETKENVLSKPMKVYQSLLRSIIPNLKSVLSAKTKSDSEHKLNKSKYPEDEDIKRIPLAFAIVKLLKKLPKKALHMNINSIFMKLITFLKSNADSIRNEARSMMAKVMLELGGEYLTWLVKDMKTILSRGFQNHVLAYTLHYILSTLKDNLKPKHIDNCISDIMTISMEDLFSDKNEEKEVVKITIKVREAKSEKGYNIMGIMSEVTAVEGLSSIMLPLKELVTEKQNKKIVLKVTKCLQEIYQGLERNKYVTLHHKSMFIFGILKEKILELSEKPKNENKIKVIERHDSFLIEPEPKRAGAMPKTTFKTTSYIFVEFALNLFYSLLRHEKFTTKDELHAKLVEPYLSIMSNYVDSNYPEVSLKALHCVEWIIKFKCPSLDSDLQIICGKVFVILRKFSSPDLQKGKVYDLVQVCYKFISLIIRTVENFNLKEDHIKILLDYAKCSLNNNAQSTSTLDILQSIITRKIEVEELHTLMTEVREMSITKEIPHIIDAARRTYYKYITTYPISSKQVTENILFYLGNISFDSQNGKLSSVLMLKEIISHFPNRYFGKDLETSLFLEILKQLMVEECQENITLLNSCLKTLYERSKRRDYLLGYCHRFLVTDSSRSVYENAQINQMGAVGVKAILNASANTISKEMLVCVLPSIVSLLHPSIYALDSVDDEQSSETEMIDLEKQNIVDNSLMTLLEVFSKLFSIYKDNPLCAENLDSSVWAHVKEHLLYPNIHIRILASGLIGQLLAHYPVEKDILPPLANTTDIARSLALDLCEQLCTEAPIGDEVKQKLHLNVVRNLIYLIKLSKKVSLIKPDELLKDSDNADRSNFTKGAKWVLQRVGNHAYAELNSKGVSVTLLREALLNFMAGLVVIIGNDLISCEDIVSYIIKHITREQEDEHLPEVLTSKTNDLADLIRSKVGAELYNKLVITSKMQLNKKKWKRKAHERELIISHPVLAQSKKRKKHEAKAEAKKRKYAEKKGKPTKKKLKDMAIADE